MKRCTYGLSNVVDSTVHNAGHSSLSVSAAALLVPIRKTRLWQTAAFPMSAIWACLYQLSL